MKSVFLGNVHLLQYANTVDEILLQYVTPLKAAKNEKKPKGAKRKKQRYPRDEAAYNAGQENEFLFFIGTLPFIVFNAIMHSGLKLSDANLKRYFAVYVCLAIKEYFGLSLRRSVGLCKFIFWAMRWKCKVPCFKTMENYMMKRDAKTILDRILEFAASPLHFIETHFNIDSVCETTRTASSWYNYRIGRKIMKKDHLKEHVTSTARYNVAVAVDISSEGDAKFIRPHVYKIVMQGFTLNDMSGDKAYLSRDGCNAVSEVNGRAHFKIKSNTTAKPKSSPEWKRMVLAQKKEDPREIDAYNKRQNAESTNHAKKSKFGSVIRSKRDETKETEATMKWCVYNISAICRAYYDNAIDPDFLHANIYIERLLNYT